MVTDKAGGIFKNLQGLFKTATPTVEKASKLPSVQDVRESMPAPDKLEKLMQVNERCCLTPLNRHIQKLILTISCGRPICPSTRG
jgi:hypothetical protein